MGLDIAIAVGITACGLVLTWLAFEMTFKAPNKAMVLKIRIALAVCGCGLVGLTVWNVVRASRAMNELPKRVADYVRNTSVPDPVNQVAAVNGRRPPGAPTELFVYTEPDLADRAIQVSTSILGFLASRGAYPKQRPGEPLPEFLDRSNAWYEQVLRDYQKGFQPDAIGVASLLATKKGIDPKIEVLARNPVNLIGIRELAMQLGDAGRKILKDYEE